MMKKQLENKLLSMNHEFLNGGGSCSPGQRPSLAFTHWTPSVHGSSKLPMDGSGQWGRSEKRKGKKTIWTCRSLLLNSGENQSACLLPPAATHRDTHTPSPYTQAPWPLFGIWKPACIRSGWTGHQVIWIYNTARGTGNLGTWWWDHPRQVATGWGSALKSGALRLRQGLAWASLTSCVVLPFPDSSSFKGFTGWV